MEIRSSGSLPFSLPGGKPEIKTSVEDNTAGKLKKAKLTVLSYMAADNNLEPAITSSLSRLELAGSNSDMNIVAQLDRGEEPVNEDRPLDGYYPAKKEYPSGASRYYVLQGDLDQKSNSRVLEALGQVDSSSIKTLADFLVWGIKNFPAENYLIVFNSHGGGYLGALLEKDRVMPLSDIEKALDYAVSITGVRKDKIMIAFDACHMAQAEVAYQLKDYASVLVASQGEINTNFPYESIFKNMDYQNLSGMAERIVKMCEQNPDGTPAVSAINLERISCFKESLNSFSRAILESGISRDVFLEKIKSIPNYIPVSQSDSQERNFPRYDMKDIYAFAQSIALDPEISDMKLKMESEKLMKSIKDLVIAKTKDGQIKSSGISIYMPYKDINLDEFEYRNLDLCRDTLWDEALQKLLAE